MTAALLACPASATATTVRLASSEFTTAESAGRVTVTLISSGETDVNVSYATKDGTATAPGDYGAVAGTVHIAAGSGPQVTSIDIPLKYDTLVEGDETFSFVISAVSGGEPSAPLEQTITVRDSSRRQSLAFAESTSFVRENAVEARLPVLRAGGSGGTASVHFSTAGGGALPGLDFTPTSGTLLLGQGQSYAVVRVPILQNQFEQQNRAFTLQLDTPIGAVLGRNAATTVTILDDDSPPMLRLSSERYRTSERAGGISITVLRQGATGAAAGASWTASGAVTKSGSVTFAPGQVATTFLVPFRYDRRITGDRTVTLRLSNPSGAGLTDPAIATLALRDADLPTAPPAARIRMATRQRAARRPGITIWLTPNSRQRLVGRGNLTIGEATLHLRVLRRTVYAGSPQKVVLRFPRGSWRAIAAARKAGRSVRATVVLRLTDAAGRSIVLRRRVSITG